VKNTPIKKLDAWSKLKPSNQIKRVTINSSKNKQQEIKEEGEHKNLFTLFGLMMTYSGGESSSLFHYNDMSFFTKRY